MMEQQEEDEKESITIETTQDEDNNNNNNKNGVEIPEYMDHGYAWVIVIAVSGIMLVTWGINSSFGVYLAYYLKEDPFNEQGQNINYIYAMTMGLSVSLALLVPPIVNGLIQKVKDPRIPILIGLLIEFIGLFTASFTTRVWQLLLTQGLAFGLGSGFMFAAAVPIPAQWFHKRRSLAQGICVGGSGLGGLIFSLGASSMLTRFGYKWSFRISSFIQLATSLVCGALIKLPPTHSSIKPSNYKYFNWESLKRIDFIFLCLFGFFSMFGYTAILYSLSAYSTNILHVNNHKSGIVTALMCLSNMFGRPIAGFLSDKFGRFNITILYTIISGLSSLLLWTFALNYHLILFFAIFNGFFHGIFWVSATPLTAEIVQLHHLPSNLSLIWLTAFPPLLLAELIAIAIRGNNGSNKIAFQGIAIFSGSCFLIAAACLTVTRHKAKRIKSISRIHSIVII